VTAAGPYEGPEGSFLAAVGIRFDPVVPAGIDTVVRGYLDVDQRHHTPWGVVHGGVWATVIESAASVGASEVVAERGDFAVGVDNVTDFLRPVRSGRIDVRAAPVQIGRTLQMWQVQLTDADGRLVASGRVRLANQALPAKSPA
jgi:1,4-dihydroxy-2-naphthoyl-CoA hydrolase